MDTTEKHTPKDHQQHGPDEPCGCWLGEGDAIVCQGCGAAYIPENVHRFPRWHCYDCLGVVYTDPDKLPGAF